MKDFMIERQPKTKMVLNLGTRSYVGMPPLIRRYICFIWTLINSE